MRTVENPVTKFEGIVFYFVFYCIFNNKFLDDSPGGGRISSHPRNPLTPLDVCIYLVSELSECDDVFSGVADLPLVELVLERLHDRGSVAHRVNQHNAKTPEDFLKKMLESNETLLHYVNSQLSK